MQVIRWIVAATIFIALLFLSLQNSEPAELKFFNLTSIRAPLVVIVFIAFALGAAMGLLAGTLRAARLKRQIGKLRRDHGKLQDPTAVAHNESPLPGQVHGHVRSDLSHRGH